MSKERFYGTALDGIYRTTSLRVPGFAVYLWNPHRTTINEVVLKEARSPRYEITQWVKEIQYTENIQFESGQDAQASRAVITLVRDAEAFPIEITERTLIDGAPIQIWQGDRRIPVSEWVPIFTGVLRGNPEVQEDTRLPGQQHVMSVLAVDRSEAFLNTVVTAFSYSKDDDVGKAVVETAVQFMGLDRREVKIGEQDYRIGHPQAQLVDVEILNGLHEILFTVGKKPKFNSDGFFITADTDLDKPPARVHTTKKLVVNLVRVQNLISINNSIRLLGLSNKIVHQVEPEQRLAFGRIVSGFWEDEVRMRIDFSEKKGKEGGRRAKETRAKLKITSIGEFFGGEASWVPTIEDDGETVFGGRIIFDTGYAPEIRITLTAVWFAINVANVILAFTTTEGGLAAAAAASTFDGAAPGLAVASSGQGAAATFKFIEALTLLLLLLSFTELGNLDFEIFGKPFMNVYQQLAATAQIAGLLTQDIKEVQFRNDWLYDLDVTLRPRAKELLRREIAKGWIYEIVILDDPLLEVDDLIQIEDRVYYVNGIRKRYTRESNPDATMTLTAWRVK